MIWHTLTHVYLLLILIKWLSLIIIIHLLKRLLSDLIIFGMILISSFQHLNDFLFISLVEVLNKSKQLLLTHILKLIKYVRFALIHKNVLILQEQIHNLINVLLYFVPLFFLYRLLIRNYTDGVLLVDIAFLSAERVD